MYSDDEGNAVRKVILYAVIGVFAIFAGTILFFAVVQGNERQKKMDDFKSACIVEGGRIFAEFDQNPRIYLCVSKNESLKYFYR